MFCFARRWIFRLVIATAVAIGLGYMPYRAYGPGGVGRVLRLERDRTSIVEGNTKLERDNRRLRYQIRRLKNDRHAIERVARDDLGLAGANDLVFLFDR